MQVRALVCRSVWSAALVGSLLAGCGGEAGVDGQELEPEGVSEALPADDAMVEPDGAAGQAPEEPTHSAFAMNCPSTSVTWSEERGAWNSNPNTVGIYTCYANVPLTSSGGNRTVTATGMERTTTSTAQFNCSDGVWVRVSGTCDGRVIETSLATGNASTCSSADPVKIKWINWFLADLKRCPDSAGLNWWVNAYNTSASCPASTNYDGYGSKDACWRANFQAGANANGNSYNEAQALGHISSWDEEYLCGSLSYPYSAVPTYGTKCKYRP